MTSHLQNSSADDVMLCHEFMSRLVSLKNDYARIRGVDLQFPDDLKTAFYKVRSLSMRHRSGDHRHTQGELNALRTLCQWSLDVNCEIRNQPKQKLQWQ